MTNPVFTRNKVFTERTPAGYPAMPGYQVGNGNHSDSGRERTAYRPTQEYPNDRAQGYPPTPPPAYPQPLSGFGTGQDTRAMTLDDVLIKSVFTFLTLLVGGTVSWFTTETNPSLGMSMLFGGMVVAFVLAMINSFKTVPSPALILGYAFFEGLMLGAVSRMYAGVYDGVVPKAIGATVVTALVMFVLFKTKLIRNSPTLMRVIFVGMASLCVFYLVNFVVSLIFPALNFSHFTVFGFPLWVVVSLVAIVLAALSLVSDFDFIFQAVENRAPARTAWTCAFGLMVTLVWLYLEFLRLLAIFSSSDR